MTREQQFNLIKELRAVLTERGLTQKELAAHIGTSAGTLSAVFSLKGQMREERWRMACEFCSLDFDALMGYAKAPPVQSSPVQSSPNRA